MTKELALATVTVTEPDPDDEVIASLADPVWLDWMHRNFTEPDDVPELGGARPMPAVCVTTRDATRSPG